MRLLCAKCKERLKLLKVLSEIREGVSAADIARLMQKKNSSYLLTVVLPLLKKDKLVDFKIEKPRRKKGRPRKLWFITEKGKKILESLIDPPIIEVYFAGAYTALQVLDNIPLKVNYLLSAGHYWKNGRLEFKKVSRPGFADKLFIDSGAQQFYTKFKGYDYPYTPRQYLEFSRQLSPDYIATLDLPLDILVPRGLSIHKGLKKTVELGVKVFCEAESMGIRDKIVPVLQGYNDPTQWLESYDLYRSHGIRSNLWGVGSLCMMKSSKLVKEILESLSNIGDLHVFGLALNAFRKVYYYIRSFDTSAWIYWAKMDGAVFVWDPFKERFVELQARKGLRYDTKTLMAVNVFSILSMVNYYILKKSNTR